MNFLYTRTSPSIRCCCCRTGLTQHPEQVLPPKDRPHPASLGGRGGRGRVRATPQATFSTPTVDYHSLILSGSASGHLSGLSRPLKLFKISCTLIIPFGLLVSIRCASPGRCLNPFRSLTKTMSHQHAETIARNKSTSTTFVEALTHNEQYRSRLQVTHMERAHRLGHRGGLVKTDMQQLAWSAL